jgi:histidinol phosphatase-like PHP family hydrolase
MLQERGVAAEINFHTNEPPEEFFRMCLDEGANLTFGSDSHNLYEVGDFALHLDFLERCGFDGDLSDVLIDPRTGEPI